MKTDIEMLGRLINLPERPNAAQWEVIQAGEPGDGLGPNDWSLAAVLNVSAATQARLVASAAPLTQGSVLAKSVVRDWFPPELKALFSPTADGSVRAQGELRDAATFARSPLLNGFFIPVGSQQVFVYLYTQ